MTKAEFVRGIALSTPVSVVIATAWSRAGLKIKPTYVYDVRKDMRRKARAAAGTPLFRRERAYGACIAFMLQDLGDLVLDHGLVAVEAALGRIRSKLAAALTT